MKINIRCIIFLLIFSIAVGLNIWGTKCFERKPALNIVKIKKYNIIDWKENNTVEKIKQLEVFYHDLQ